MFELINNLLSVEYIHINARLYKHVALLIECIKQKGEAKQRKENEMIIERKSLNQRNALTCLQHRHLLKFVIAPSQFHFPAYYYDFL